MTIDWKKKKTYCTVKLWLTIFGKWLGTGWPCIFWRVATFQGSLLLGIYQWPQFFDVAFWRSLLLVVYSCWFCSSFAWWASEVSCLRNILHIIKYQMILNFWGLLMECLLVYIAHLSSSLPKGETKNWTFSMWILY